MRLILHRCLHCAGERWQRIKCHETSRWIQRVRAFTRNRHRSLVTTVRSLCWVDAAQLHRCCVEWEGRRARHIVTQWINCLIDVIVVARCVRLGNWTRRLIDSWRNCCVYVAVQSIICLIANWGLHGACKRWQRIKCDCAVIVHGVRTLTWNGE